MFLEDYAEQIGRDLSQRPVALTGLDVLSDVGGLRTARDGDSISSILGSSNPAAIGAFMDANALKDSRLRAGESYLIPRRADLADPALGARGQAALNADNARLVAHSASLLPSESVTVRPGTSVFDPQKGILATRPAMAGQRAGGSKPSRESGWDKASKVAGITGHVVDGYDMQNHLLDLMFKGKNIAKTVGSGVLGPALGILEHTTAGIGEARKGAPVGPVAMGVAGKLGAIGVGTMGGTLLAGPPGGLLAGMAAGAGLNGVSNEKLGRKVQGQMEELGRNPYGYGAF